MTMFRFDDTIAAPATAPGGALAIIRISGPEALAVCDCFFRAKSSKPLKACKGRTVHYGNIYGPDGGFIDEVLVTVFRAPSSYTGEEMAEITCHGSGWIVSRIMSALTAQGVRTAEAGEFTARAFLAGKLDLTQAEAVADMIASDNCASHALAATQLRGSYSATFAHMREELLHLASLLELELDFSEEDVTFADREGLMSILRNLESETARLLNSFTLGNAVKEGVTVAIAGKPNVGKSTLLNRLLGEDRAMVSDIAGTTRDSIEEVISIGGVGFRFIDTAGLHESGDVLERMGIERTYKILANARIALYMTEAANYSPSKTLLEISGLGLGSEQRIAVVVNKWDTKQEDKDLCPPSAGGIPVIPVSAKFGLNMDGLERFLMSCIDASAIYGGEAVMSNARHYEALSHASETLSQAIRALADEQPADLVAEELRAVLDGLDTITGKITTTEILNEIFSRFCIGK